MSFGILCLSPVSDTYALEDLVYTLDSSNSSQFFYFCSDSESSSPNCSGYFYIFISQNSYCPTSGYIAPYDFQYGYNDQPFPISVRLYADSFILYYVPSFASFFHRSFSLSSGCEITVRVSENNPYSSGIIPSGLLSITENGTYDVTNYAEAVVDVPTSSGGDGGEDCDYHDDLVKIYQGIMTCGGVLLVLYFFYCIYRMIIKSTGGY